MRQRCRIQQIGTPCFRRGAMVIPLLEKLASGLLGDRRDVVLGSRAEDMVDTAMPAGSNQFLGMIVESSMVFIRVAKDSRMREGQAVAFGLNPARLHLFDKANGQSMLAGAAA